MHFIRGYIGVKPLILYLWANFLTGSCTSERLFFLQEIDYQNPENEYNRN
jgi:hypothetical protein